MNVDQETHAIPAGLEAQNSVAMEKETSEYQASRNSPALAMHELDKQPTSPPAVDELVQAGLILGMDQALERLPNRGLANPMNPDITPPQLELMDVVAESIPATNATNTEPIECGAPRSQEGIQDEESIPPIGRKDRVMSSVVPASEDGSVEKPIEQSGQEPATLPVSKLVEGPSENLAEEPVEVPVDEPVDNQPGVYKHLLVSISPYPRQ